MFSSSVIKLKHNVSFLLSANPKKTHDAKRMQAAAVSYLVIQSNKGKGKP